MAISNSKLQSLATRLRADVLRATTAAGSGHPTSCLSAADAMAALFFGGAFHADLRNPKQPNNDRLIFSKGHAAPLLYALYAAAGKISDKELLTLRKFGSRLEGHPTPAFPYTEAATGSLGQGLSVGVGMALAARMDKLPYRTYVLMGDSEMAEGQAWEAVQYAGFQKLGNLTAIIDVNRLGQRGQTMLGHNLEAYAKRLRAFGWQTFTVDGHDLKALQASYQRATKVKNRPTAIIAKTIKGKGVSFLENKNGWHGKALTKFELRLALYELGKTDAHVRGVVPKPKSRTLKLPKTKLTKKIAYNKGLAVATREAYGNALVRLAPAFPQFTVLDAEVGNSTFAEKFFKVYPKKFLEMYIAEQNMVSVALGMARRGKLPFVSTFAAFLTRAFDQFRMAQYSDAHIVAAGSHAGVSIGSDGASQMGLEDIGMFRLLQNSTVLYPSDAVSCEKLVEQAAKAKGIVYIRTTREKSPVLYKNTESFPISGSKTLRESRKDKATIISAGITLHEALKAANELAKKKINVRVIDLYSIKPLDVKTLRRAAKQTKHIITVEDHVSAGGIGEAVREAITGLHCKLTTLAVRKIPHSGKPEQLLRYEGVDAQTIARFVKRNK
jgi:transketolase